MSPGLQGAKPKYAEVDKQSFVVFKDVKHFETYILKSKAKVIVPYPTLRNLLQQKELGANRELIR